MTRDEPHKFIGFFKLIEAMEQGGCPVCRRITDDTHHAMESFLYESVNDSGLRDEIRHDHGLCHRHSWQLTRFGDALGSAILFGDILESILPKLGAVAAPWTHKPPRNALGNRDCFFCRLERRSHEGVLSELAAHLDDPELQAAWDGPALLCIGHLSEVCARVRPAKSRKTLLERHRAKYACLCGQMRELVMKQSYDHRSDEIGTEKDSWVRAIEALVGRPGTR